MTFFDNIVGWNHERGLIDRKFDHGKEVSFIVEELLESTGKYTSETAKDKSQEIASVIMGDTTYVNPSTIVDAFADIIVFSTGAIAKLGYNPNKVLSEVFKEIDSRKGKLIDGKFVKDLNIEMYKADFTTCRFDKIE